MKVHLKSKDIMKPYSSYSCNKVVYDHTSLEMLPRIRGGNNRETLDWANLVTPSKQSTFSLKHCCHLKHYPLSLISSAR